MISDWEILLDARKGNESACKTLFEKHYRLLVRMAALITGSIDTAKDVTQETFVRLLNRRIKHTKGNFKTYVTTIAFRLALKEKKRSNRNLKIGNHELLDVAVTPAENQINKDNNKHIYKTIISLPENQKEILILRFYGGISYEEIAAILEVPIGTVKSRIFYAVKACRENLKELGVIE